MRPVPKPSRRKLGSDIFVVRFATQYALASTFLRIQEHYESSHFRSRVFSLEEFMDWYAAKFGAFTYLQDWSGFNVPSTALKPFYEGKFDPLSRKEQALLRMFKRERGPFYIIGLSRKADLTHELAHALFFTRPAYRKAVLSELGKWDTSAIARHLAKLGYHKAVLTDEVHAYLVSAGDAAGMSVTRFAVLRRALRQLFRAHSKGLPRI